MLKTIAKLEYNVGERIYQFLCDLDSPTTEIRLVTQEINKFLDKVEEQAKAKENPQEQEKMEEDQTSSNG